MRFNDIITHSDKAAKKFDSINATLLQKGGFIDQTMAGVYTFLPMGFRVLTKIENIVREEMNRIGTEILMPALAPRELWQRTGRDKMEILFETKGVGGANKQADYLLNSTHEEIVTPIMLKHRTSYRDLPFAVYQIQTKFRNEARPKSGLLRGREFRMKDLYSFHASEADRTVYYNRVIEVYRQIFKRMNLGEETVIARASGGDFTREWSLEFDTKCETGEDVVYRDKNEDIYYNAEIAPDSVKQQGESWRVSEVGNIFPLGTKFTEAFGYYFTDQAGKQQPVVMASYGIGTSRLMGVLVEKFHDQRGIIWPEAVAPWRIHLIALNQDVPTVKESAEQFYQQALKAGLEILFDDRTAISAGEKLALADLIGCPWRAVISQQTKNQVEIKRRDKTEFELFSQSDALSFWQK